MTHTETGTSATDRPSRRRLYRRLMGGFIVGGVTIALVLTIVFDYPLVAEVVYWLGILGFLAVWKLSSVTLFDERDRALERRASQLTVTVIGVVLVVGATIARMVPEVSAYELPDAVGPALLAYGSVFVVFILAYVYLRYRR